MTAKKRFPAEHQDIPETRERSRGTLCVPTPSSPLALCMLKTPVLMSRLTATSDLQPHGTHMNIPWIIRSHLAMTPRFLNLQAKIEKVSVHVDEGWKGLTMREQKVLAGFCHRAHQRQLYDSGKHAGLEDWAVGAGSVQF